MPGVAKNVDTVVFVVRVGGKEMPSEFGVVSIEICRDLDRIASAELVLYDGDAAAQSFDISSSAAFVPGVSVEIHAGYHDERDLLFSGIVVRQQIRARRGGNSLLTVQCRDAAHRMTTARSSRYFKDLTESQLFEEIAEQHGLKGEITPTSESQEEVVQYQVSDWDFLLSRAERLGHHVSTADGTLRIAPLPTEAGAAPSFGYGDGIFDIDLELDASHLPERVTARSWSATDQAVLTAESDRDEVPTPGNLESAKMAKAAGSPSTDLRHSGSVVQQDLDAWAAGRLRQLRLTKVRGTLRVQGSPTLQPGSIVKLAGMGDRFNGDALLAGVSHRIADGDWLSTLRIGLDPERHQERYPIAPTPGDGYAAPISGLHIGVVTGLEDETGEDRVRVRLPLIDASDEGTWVRMSRPFAGSERAIVFRPELEDEAVVGFIDNDPNQGVLMGTLNSSARATPIPGEDQNPHKGIVTTSGLKLLFDDETPSLSITTPKGNSLVLDDKDGSLKISDQHQNLIEMNQDGIKISSQRDIQLIATGDTKVEGTNVSGKATANLSLEASAQAKLTSNGTTAVKGALVQIN